MPAFLFLDQPTQVYFPADKEENAEGDVSKLTDEDRQKVTRMFNLIFQAVKELTPEFQVIITDHADLRAHKDFQKAVVERWRSAGDALIPEGW